ncbi:hypothetical protein LTR36_007382 [Oleoguttula mirabilis]|uniref:Mitochondrial intermembrane space import and assembly protein 40 n=1 Tax=Oleoguttula mirabilis TaxID=1507867 RepID=A0AAV9JAQ8_9PEZI|nr:hypothetical protein LTR36_007382 [Oleoguttula mirabilis]
MYRSALRTASSSAARAAPKQTVTGRRTITTAPPHKLSRSWKSSAVRWGLAGSLVYYYNTTSVFAEEPACASHEATTAAETRADDQADTTHASPETSRESESYHTIDAVAEQRRAQASQASSPSPTTAESTVAVPDAAGAVPGSPEGLEEEAGQQGAFNEETGEINWDCPCLGGMAHGPCGEQFRAAFSCFVYSKDEPKGVDCIEHFKTMQNCFREHPEIYGSELDDDDAPPPADMHDGQPAPVDSQLASGASTSDAAPRPSLANADSTSSHGRGEKVADRTNVTPAADRDAKHERAEAATQQVQRDHGPLDESEKVVPKAAHDAT